MQSLEDIFNKKIFRIPDYQRGYAWGQKQLIEFWEDLISLDSHRSHYTGVLSIKAVTPDVYSSWHDEKWLVEKRRYTPYFVVDGQQRLTTVSVFLQCLVEEVKLHSNNESLANDEIYLGSYSLSEIIETYIMATEPKHKVTHTYKFGYEVDNPSFEFLRHHIFNEGFAGTLKETFYTLNLENAKAFFKENIHELLNRNGLDALEDLYIKLTQRLLFNLYEIDDNFDVFVAFETMNNRGKQLSDLELLKNRLIYLTTLYSPKDVSEDIKETTRKKINDAWGEVYNQLGRNKLSPLNDDEFLKAHWVMYFKYSRVKGNDYIRYLLDEHFSPKNVFEKLEVSTQKISNVEILSDEEINDEDDINDSSELVIEKRSKLTIKDIGDYVDSLKVAAKIWYATFFPQDSNELTDAERLMMDKINRVKIAYFRPLIMAVLLKHSSENPQRYELLKQIERFIFLNFRVCRSPSNSGSSHFSRRARDIYLETVQITDVISELNEHLEWMFDENNEFKTSSFKEFITKKFANKQGAGFYGWNELRYFLFEYEEELKHTRGQSKIGWKNFIKSEKDKVSIEHILPQTDDNQYWAERFSMHSTNEKRFLKGSLGNLLPLSSSINSSLQNDSFPEKKNTKKDNSGKVIRNGYSNGSYSEIEVSQNEDWSALEILNRGLSLLEFMEKRWVLNLGTHANKLELLHLSFLEEKIMVDADAETVLEEEASA
nr:DUF262 domain-containing protein [Thalassotalea sp. G2M2-11]